MSGYFDRFERRQSRESFQGEELVIESLADLNATIDALFEELERAGNPALLEELCPYFGVVWPSARALAERLAVLGRDALSGKRVLEVGCGLAVPSLIAARKGARVTATDFHPDVPRFLARNQELNAINSIEYVALDWQRAPSGSLGRFDLVIGSDILYERQHPQQVAPVLARFLAPRGKILLADPARPYLQAFSDEMQRLGFDNVSQVVRVPDEPQPKDVFILEFSHNQPGSGRRAGGPG
jgi:predicted nicotinamide N-methyase